LGGLSAWDGSCRRAHAQAHVTRLLAVGVHPLVMALAERGEQLVVLPPASPPADDVVLRQRPPALTVKPVLRSLAVPDSRPMLGHRTLTLLVPLDSVRTLRPRLQCLALLAEPAVSLGGGVLMLVRPSPCVDTSRPDKAAAGELAGAVRLHASISRLRTPPSYAGRHGSGAGRPQSPAGGQ
jgi:hypothetical protein